MPEPTHTIASVQANDSTSLWFRHYHGSSSRCRGSIVYLHGIQSHGGWYHDTANEIARRGYSVYLADRRGSGLNTHPRGHFTNPAELVDDVKRLVDHARAKAPTVPVFLIGGCWGARTAVTFAATHGDDLAGMVLICPALKAKVDLSLREKARVLVGSVRSASTVPIPLRPEQFTGQPEWLDFIRADDLALREVRSSFFLKQAVWDRRILRQSALSLPMLLLQAGQDEIVDVDGVRRWFDQQPSTMKRYVMYPTFSHILDFEPERQRYWDDLVEWLDVHAAQRGRAIDETVPA